MIAAARERFSPTNLLYVGGGVFRALDCLAHLGQLVCPWMAYDWPVETHAREYLARERLETASDKVIRIRHTRWPPLRSGTRDDHLSTSRNKESLRDMLTTLYIAKTGESPGSLGFHFRCLLS